MYYAKFSTLLNLVVLVEAETHEQAVLEIEKIEVPPTFPVIEIPNAETMSQQQQAQFYIAEVQRLETAGTITDIDESLVH